MNGLNLLCTIWDFTYSDDSVGGALPSGTVLAERVPLRISSEKPTQALLEQGVESISLYTGVIANFTIDVQNNMELEVTAPANSPYYGKFFRVVGDPRRPSTGSSDSRGFLYLTLKRVTRSRSIQ